MENEYAITVKYIIYASPEKVFDAITKDSIINDWSQGQGKVEPFVNGKMELYDGWVKGEVKKFNKIKKELSFTWKPSEWGKKMGSSIVDFSFKKHPAGTEIIVNHKKFPSRNESEKHETGWINHFFEPLNDYFTR